MAKSYTKRSELRRLQQDINKPVTEFPKGVINGVSPRYFPEYPGNDPRLVEEYFDDFQSFDQTNRYKVTKVEAGSGNTTVVCDDSQVKIVLDDAANDAAVFTVKDNDGTGVMNFLDPRQGDLFYQTRLKLSAVDASIGLAYGFASDQTAFPTFGAIPDNCMIGSISMFTSLSFLAAYQKAGGGTNMWSSGGVTDNHGIPDRQGGIDNPLGINAAGGKFIRLSIVWRNRGTAQLPQPPSVGAQNIDSRIEYWIGEDNQDDQMILAVYPNADDIMGMSAGMTPFVAVKNHGGGANKSCDVDYIHAGIIKPATRIRRVT